jgi:hypothetical protein
MSYTSIHKGKYLRRRYLEVLQPIPKQSGAVTGILAVISIVLFCLSYSFVLQPAGLPLDLEENNFDLGCEKELIVETGDFLLKISDDTYLFISDMLGKEILSEQEINNNSLYSGLPIYEKIPEGRD